MFAYIYLETQADLVMWQSETEWLLSASCFWHHRLVLALLSCASLTNPLTYLLTYRWSLYTSTIMYNTVQLLLFYFLCFEKAFASCFFFFCNALAGRRGSYQTRKLTHYLRPLFLLALCSPLCYSKVMASRSQRPPPSHTAQIEGLLIQTLLSDEMLWRQKNALLFSSV